MEFIRKHTEGPWEYDKQPMGYLTDYCEIIEASSGKRISNCVYGTKDSILISQAPVMLDYLIERAEFLEKIIKRHKNNNKYEKQELSRLLEIIRACGVEVVE